MDRCGRRVVDGLRRDGYAVRYDEFDGGQLVPRQQVTDSLDWWLLLA